ncbi:MAG TPA: hypothetical protein VFE32_01240 [Puia sp.]|jgi:hypothetical protein|nr:hypothetical protein [Puia sp.]
MATDKNKKGKDPIANAYDQAEKDISKDPELSDPDPTDDLDEGELAARDNSDEEAFDHLERPRQEGHGGHGGDAAKGHGEDGGHGGDAAKGHEGHSARGHGGHSDKGKEK